MTYSEHIQQYRARGMSIKKYCEEYNIKYATFLYHIRKQKLENPPTFIPITFSSTSQIEIQYTNGIKVFLSQDTPVTFIKSLIQ